jgi:hypothetical protein
MSTDPKKADAPAECSPPPCGAPEKEHLWLRRLCGTFDCETEFAMTPEGPTQKSKGLDVTEPFGDFWVKTMISGKPPGMDREMNGLMTLGYDPAKKKFIGTWVDNMMAFMWRYEGSLDATGNVLTLDTEGPSFTTPGATAPYRERIELRGDGEKVFSSSTEIKSGVWTTFMTSIGKRRK